MKTLAGSNENIAVKEETRSSLWDKIICMKSTARTQYETPSARKVAINTNKPTHSLSQKLVVILLKDNDNQQETDSHP